MSAGPSGYGTSRSSLGGGASVQGSLFAEVVVVDGRSLLSYVTDRRCEGRCCIVGELVPFGTWAASDISICSAPLTLILKIDGLRDTLPCLLLSYAASPGDFNGAANGNVCDLCCSDDTTFRLRFFELRGRLGGDGDRLVGLVGEAAAALVIASVLSSLL